MADPVDDLKPAADAAGAKTTEVKHAITGKASELRQQATDKARTLAEDGKARAADALGQISQMLIDVGAQVDEKIGSQYGQYARSAAEQVEGFQSSLSDRSIDDLIDDAREAVRKSPGIAMGIAAAVGFVVARVVSAGLDERGTGRA